MADQDANGLVTFLREKAAEADRTARVREDMARTEEYELTPAEWKQAMNLHPSTRGKPMPSAEERRERAARERRIAEKYRQEADRLNAAAEAVQREAEARAEAARLRAEMARAVPLHECAHILGGTQCLRCDMEQALSAPVAETLRALRELAKAAELTVLCFKRTNASEANFLGDDEHEAWTALRTALAAVPWLRDDQGRS